jgi:hypothetical protein
LLKAALFAVAMGFAACALPAAGAETALLVGSVRDGTGTPVVGAELRATGPSGQPVGGDRSDADGTFAIALGGPAVSLEVRCTHCRTERVSVAGRSNVAIVVLRYAALESDVPTSGDLSALPYGRIVDDLALVPFTVPAAGGAEISDRGLGGGDGLVLDGGVPLVDFATGTSALADFPDRYVRSIALAGPDQAFRYGSYAGGGIFALSPNQDQQSFGSVDVGGAPSLALEPVLGTIRPAIGESNDDGVLARRADLDATAGLGGGVLSVGAGSADETYTAAGDELATRDLNLAHVGYATASRNYRSFADFSAADASVFNDYEQSEAYRSSYLAADVRLERPGPVTFALGAMTTRQTGFYALGEPYPATLTGRADDETIYLQAQTGSEHFGATAGLGLSNVTVSETLGSARTDGERLALVPSLGGSVPLGSDGFYLRAGYSQALRVPSLLETDAEPSPPPNGAPLERDELGESALGFDDGGRVRAELIAYRQFAHGFDEQRLDGVGGSLVWQIAPLVSLRTWTLRATPLEYAGSFEPYSQSNTSRQVLWATYANGDGLRFDAIVHRDLSSRQALPVDADVYAPVQKGAALALGTARVAGVRRYYVGLRTR